MKISFRDFDKQHDRSQSLLSPRTFHRLCSLAVASLAIFHFGTPNLHAAGTVTNCTDEAFRSALNGGGIINFTSACSITLTGTVSVISNTTILTSGNAVTLSGGDAVRIFTVASNINLSLTGVTLSNGRSTNGGAIYISTNATVQLTNCTLTANNAIGVGGTAGNNGQTNSGVGGNGSAGSAGTSGLGGAIYNSGTLAMQNCVFTTNNATGGNGGNGGNGGAGELGGGNGGSGANGGVGFGGAIYNLASLSARDCSFATNTATGGAGGKGGTNGGGSFPGLAGSGAAGGLGSGAGIYSAQTITLVNCTFSDNQARGGNSAAAGTLGNGNGANGANGASGFGGGVFNAGTSVATNCTFYNNKVVGGNGGNGGYGDYFYGGNGGTGGNGTGGNFYSTGNATLVNNTLSHGSATGGTNGLAGAGLFDSGNEGSPGQARGGNIAREGGTFTLKNTIVATNLSGGCGYGVVVDAGNNICADASLALGGSSFVNTDPKLASIANNGGTTQTLYPLASSPAIDAGSDTGVLNFDQRGFTRPSGSHTDIGSVETLLPTLTSLSGSSTNFSFSYPTVFGLTYVIQLKTNLSDADWTSIATNVGTGSLANYSATKSSTGSRFFRLLVR